MRFVVILPLLLFAAVVHAQVTQGTVPRPEGFLSDILGASYNKSLKKWILPKSSPAYGTATDSKGDGVEVQVDTIATRQVAEELEAWVLFSMEKYVYGFCRLRVEDGGWRAIETYNKLHEGALKGYKRLNFMLQTLGPKTCIGIQEVRTVDGITNELWHLYDPFSGALMATFTLSSSGQKAVSPQAYLEFQTQDLSFFSVKNNLPDVILVQQGTEKKAGQAAKPFTRKLKYRFDSGKKTYVKT